MINNPVVSSTGGGRSDWNFASFVVSGEQSNEFWFDDSTFKSVYQCRPTIPFPLEFDNGTVVSSYLELNDMTEDSGVMYSVTGSDRDNNFTIGNGAVKISNPIVLLMRSESSPPQRPITFPNFRVFVSVKFK